MVYTWNTNDDGTIYTTFEKDGFTVNVKVVYDYDHDLCNGRGHFDDRWSLGAIKNPGNPWERDNIYTWFIPEQTPRQIFLDIYKYMDYSIENQWTSKHETVIESIRELFDHARKLFTKVSPLAVMRQIRKQIREDMLVCLGPDVSGIFAVGVVVTAEYKNIELGYDSLWGIETDSFTSDYIVHDVTDDCVASALAMAKATLENLRS